MTLLADALRRVEEEAAEPAPDGPGVQPCSPGIQSIGEALVGAGAAEPPGASAAHANQPMALFRGFGANMIGKVVGTPNVPVSAIEQYRKLAATLHHSQVQRGIKVVMMASAVTGEGKTLTTTNLALTFSQSYRRRVLVIDADLRRPSIHEVFQVPNVSGLNDGLKNKEEQKLSLVEISPCLTLLTAGRPNPDPMSGLVSDRMRRIIQEAAASFDWVLIDTPPVALLPDANLLAAMVDVALLVVRAGACPYALVERAVEAVGRDRIVGVVLNAVEESALRNGFNSHYYNYYYGYDRR